MTRLTNRREYMLNKVERNKPLTKADVILARFMRNNGHDEEWIGAIAGANLDESDLNEVLKTAQEELAWELKEGDT